MSAQLEGKARRDLVVLVAAAAVLLVALAGVLLVWPDGDAATPVAASAPAPATAPAAKPPASAPSTTDAPSSTPTSEVRNEIVCTDPSGKVVECLPENEANEVATITPREKLGWGSAQPYRMNATMQFGSSDTPVTNAERKQWGEMLVRARAAAAQTPTVADAERLGFVKNYEYIDGRGVEYINWGRWGTTFDIDKPTLVAAAGDKPTDPIVSIAYQVIGSREAGPPKDLPRALAGWHFHHSLCKAGNDIIGNLETRPDGRLYEEAAQRCLKYGATYMPALDHWMIDLWVIPGWENPWGLESSKHPDLFKDPQPWFPFAPEALKE